MRVVKLSSLPPTQQPPRCQHVTTLRYCLAVMLRRHASESMRDYCSVQIRCSSMNCNSRLRSSSRVASQVGVASTRATSRSHFLGTASACFRLRTQHNQALSCKLSNGPSEQQPTTSQGTPCRSLKYKSIKFLLELDGVEEVLPSALRLFISWSRRAGGRKWSVNRKAHSASDLYLQQVW